MMFGFSLYCKSNEIMICIRNDVKYAQISGVAIFEISIMKIEEQ